MAIAHMCFVWLFFCCFGAPNLLSIPQQSLMMHNVEITVLLSILVFYFENCFIVKVDWIPLVFL